MKNFALRALLHQLDTFSPTRNDTIEGKLDRLSGLVGAVELFTVDERAAIVDDDDVSSLRAFAGSSFSTLY